VRLPVPSLTAIVAPRREAVKQGRAVTARCAR